MIDVASIIKESTIDGEGIRYVVFTQGCKHNCKGCQNPSTHNFGCGKMISASEIYDDMIKNPLIDGLTLSGGDPFFQAKQCCELAKLCKNNGYDIWAYTGFNFEDFLNFRNNIKCNVMITSDMIELLRYIDVVVDGRFILEERTLESKFKGSSNQKIVDVKKSLKENKVIKYNLEYRGG